MVGHARIDGRIDEKVIRNLMIVLTVEEAVEEGKGVLIVRASREGHWIERRRGGNNRKGLTRIGKNQEWLDMIE